MNSVRIDKWLWAVRLYKTRTLAITACKGNKVTIGGEPVKPSREVKVGEIISARTSEVNRTVKVLGLLEKRVGPKLVADYLEDLTPAEEYLAAIQRNKNPVSQRPRGSGRPTKRDRRQIEQFNNG
jgi:ribosome-associated heat shock protein Hsp15